MSPADIGEVVGLSRNAANQAVHRARGRLKEAVEARVLWHRGKPKCSELTSELKEAGIEDFDALALACIGSHVTDCKKCQGRRALQLDPSKMFAAVPFLGVAWALRAQTAHALSNAGVPMGKSVGLAPRDPDRPRRFSSRRASKFIGAGLVVVVVLTGLVFSGEVGDGRLFESESSPQVTPSTVAAVIPELTPEVTVTTRARGLAPAPVETGTAGISISPGSAICCSFVSPTVTWSSSGGARVEVLGANLSSSFPSGSTEICPGSTATGKCVAGSGLFVYRVTVYGTSDQVLAESTVAFSVS
ncbi:MAG: sigma-70 family RNA polymerase sigma factor [Acidimicrobiia bacterium]|nr:sigma-70 family RNA polymerase sigma factor [Acidimicrobiia bacterium]